LRVAHRIPYSDLGTLNEGERARLLEEGRPLEFGHTLSDQIGGQLAAGFVLTGFYEDIDPESVLGVYIPSYMATRALKPSLGSRAATANDPGPVDERGGLSMGWAIP